MKTFRIFIGTYTLLQNWNLITLCNQFPARDIVYDLRHLTFEIAAELSSKDVNTTSIPRQRAKTLFYVGSHNDICLYLLGNTLTFPSCSDINASEMSM